MLTLLTKRFVSLLMGTTLLIGFFLCMPTIASAHSTVAQSTSSATLQTQQMNAAKYSGACVAKGGARRCLAPTRYDNICGGTQWYADTSHDGHPIGYTYTYGSRHCLTVTWDLSNISSSDLKYCSALMYIPSGNATAVVQYTTNNGKSGSILDQSQYGINNVGEFVQIFQTGDLSGNIQLTDQTVTSQGSIGNNQGWHAAKIGWGTDPAYSLDLECP